MTARYKTIAVPSLAYGPVSIRFDRDWEEYQVRIKGNPEATYHTTDRDDALGTAQRMRNTLPTGDAK